MKSRTMIEFHGGGGGYNQAPASYLAESNGIKRHPEPKAKDSNKKQVDSSVASLLQNDVQGASGFFGLCPHNDMTHCDEPIRSDLSDENTQNSKCRDSEVNNNCRQGKRQRRVLSERSEFTRLNAESCKLLANEACGWFPSLCHQSDRRPRRTKQKHEVDSSVASLLQNDVQGAGKFFGLCPQNDKAAQGDSSGFSPQNDIKKDVILSQRRRIHLKPNWILHSVQNDRKKSKHAAFTMAEVLITIGIIGLVAAMTMPSLINNHRNKALEAGLKKNYSVISQALAMYQAQNGITLTSADIRPRELKSLIMPYFNVLIDCGIGTEEKACIFNDLENSSNSDNIYKTYNNNTLDLGYFDDGQFILTDGSMIFIENSTVENDPRRYISVDVNGYLKRPNKLGFDLFMFQIDKNGKILPMGASGTDYEDERYYCSPTSVSTMNGAACTYKALTDKYYFKNLH